MEESNFAQTESSRSGSHLFFIQPTSLHYLQFTSLIIISMQYNNLF